MFFLAAQSNIAPITDLFHLRFSVRCINTVVEDPLLGK